MLADTMNLGFWSLMTIECTIRVICSLKTQNLVDQSTSNSKGVVYFSKSDDIIEDPSPPWVYFRIGLKVV